MRPPLKNELTALVLTYNEQENIGRTLTAIDWVSRVVVVDSCSTDHTRDIIARHPNAIVIEHPFETFARQCEFGISLIGTEWVLSLDADYVVTPALAAEIQSLGSDVAADGYYAAFQYCIFGKPLRSTIYPPRAILFRRKCARYHDEGHGHKVAIEGLVLSFTSVVQHDDRKRLSRWITSQDQYAAIEATNLLHASPNDLKFQDRLRLRVYLAPTVIFFYLLIYRGLLLDGWRGWYYVMQRVVAECLLSLRLLSEKHHLEENGNLRNVWPDSTCDGRKPPLPKF
jgi:glycosyltransferase involved in cell wall biosynthesis